MQTNWLLSPISARATRVKADRETENDSGVVTKGQGLNWKRIKFECTKFVGATPANSFLFDGLQKQFTGYFSIRF